VCLALNIAVQNPAIHCSIALAPPALTAAAVCTTPLPSGVSPVHGLFAGAGEDGLLECWDVRQRSSVGSLDVAATVSGAGGQQLTALRFDDSGLIVAAGTSNGLVALFDLRWVGGLGQGRGRVVVQGGPRTRQCWK
jgi:ribosome biogenesis protein ENP2